MRFGTLTVLMSLSLLTGCATLNEKECRSADWHQLGIKDGLQGEPASRLEKHKEACTRHGIQPNEARYLTGREVGLAQYCQPGNAFRLGMNGQEYKGVCPLDVDLQFRRNNTAALEVQRTKNKMADIDQQLSQKEHELTEDDTPEKEKIALRKGIWELDQQRDRLRDDLYYQQQELDRLLDAAR